MEKININYEGFANLKLVISKPNFDALKSQMLDANKYFTACQFTLDEKDVYDKKLIDILQNAKKANWNYISTIGNQVFAQMGDEYATKIPYPTNLSSLFERSREELFSVALEKSKKLVNTLNNHLDGHLTRKEVLSKGKVSIPANIALSEEEQVKTALGNLFNYFVSGLESPKENHFVDDLDDSKEM